MDFERAPFIAVWEITRACELACRHCRAAAIPERHPGELTTGEGRALIDEIAALGVPLLVLTGGDPLLRPDVFDLIAHAARRGLHVSLAPSATSRLNRDAVRRARQAGCSRFQISLDGATADVHDAFRGVSGTFQRTLEACGWCREEGVPLQLATTVSRHNRHQLPALAQLAAELGAVMWNLFFLVPTGRGKPEDMLPPEEVEEVLAWLWDTAATAPYDVKTTAAPFFRRVALQRGLTAGGAAVKNVATGRVGAAQRAVPRSLGGQAPRGVTDGCGFVFVSHTGDICPSGFLPLAAGNVRTHRLSEVYRESEMFRSLRDPSRWTGKCAVCAFRFVCGGSRARAYAVYGDPLASDPACAYQPAPSAGPAA